ncbi:MAG: DUF3108 domain-containing protein [Rikenellaceae bacterium]|nr:DUF3108 domain-containing protein [Rikenellaceae bacterium]
MKLKIFIPLLACICSLAAATGQKIPATNGSSPLDKEKEIAFSDNEKLTYIVSYSAALIPRVDAGEVVLRTSRTTVNSKPAYNIYANAKVLASFKSIFDLDDTYQSWLAADDLKPLKYSFRLREGKYRANCDYTYDWPSGKVKTHYHNLKKPEGRTTVISLKSRSYDAIALFYNLRCVDMGNFSVGGKYNLQMVLDDKIRTVTFKFLGREQRKIGKLGTFNTLKFSCTIATSSDSESFEDGSEFFLWVTDDKNRIPVYLESPIKVGSVKVTLTDYQNLKHPVGKAK